MLTAYFLLSKKNKRTYGSLLRLCLAGMNAVRAIDEYLSK